jgi:integrase
MWYIPEDRMKMQRAHDVPLSDHAMRILNEMKAYRRVIDPRQDYIFPGRLHGQPVGQCSLVRLMQSLDMKSRSGKRITVHGFRGTFKRWAHEQEDVPTYDKYAIEWSIAHNPLRV